MNLSRLVVRTVLAIILIAFFAGPLAAQSPQASEKLAVAGLFPDYGVIATPMPLPAGATRIGKLNSRGEGSFELQNPSREPIASLLVALDTGKPVERPIYGCSQLGIFLKTCTAEVSGNLIYILFSGEPEIRAGARFRLGFAPSAGGAGWPPDAEVTVTPNGQIPRSDSR
jgi:hypothetical protein